MKKSEFTLKEFHDMLDFILEHNPEPEIDIRLNYNKWYDIFTNIHRIITYNENMEVKNETEKRK